ncbi:MAG TPA: HupE/UreJ family protein [Vicinamibacterales bacterium]|nr:HupE/UreJ family protein [Vicinamibacterales bacterium]
MRSRLRQSIGVLAAAAGIIVLRPVPVYAHLNSTGLGPIYDGAAHVMLSPADLIPACAIALLAGLRGPRHSRAVLAALPMSWLLGGIAGMLFGHASSDIAAVPSFLLLGVLVAVDARVSLRTLATLTVVLGLVHGYINGIGMEPSGHAVEALLGLSMVLFVIGGLVTAFVIQSRQPWRRIAIRVLGSWVAASGLLMVGWALHRTGAKP